MRKLYPYQEKVFEHLRQNKNVIIQAPTGAGKTWAALYPYFHMLDQYNGRPDAPLPSTCRYAVPMRVLATQFEREFREYFNKMDTKRGTDFTRRYGEKLGVSLPAIQTGETPDDREFESPLTFCTIDQLLASFIGVPYSIGQRMANINVGAIVGSYLILDEFHLYPLEKTGNGARMTTLAMLQMLKGFSPFVMMTATFSTELLESLGTLLNAEVVRVTDDKEIAQIMRERSRTIRCAPDVLTPAAILDAHKSASARDAGATLVVCNTVARAQEIYRELCAELTRQEIGEHFKVQLLHSRFTPEDRKEKSANLEKWLGEDRWQEGRFVPIDGKEVIVVGTQVVEVGLNISAGVLHTELAPANSLIQRAGRCARFAGQRGEVIVYPIPLREGSTEISYLPYNDVLCEATWQHLSDSSATTDTPLPFGFTEEQILIDHVHTCEDRHMLAVYRKADISLQKTIKDVLATHQRGKESDLIRNVEQVSVIIHAEPETAITVKPFNWQAFGIHPGTLAGAWKGLEQRRTDLGLDVPDWTMKELQLEGERGSAGEIGGDILGAEGDNDHQPAYTWSKMHLSEKNAYSLIRSALRIALPPQLAAYDSDLGFRLLLTPDAPVGEWQSKEHERDKKKPDFSGSQGSYVEHISGLMRAYRFSIQSEFDWIAQRLERAMSLPSGKLDLAVRLAIACHDIGKLSQGWQKWAREWQKLLEQQRDQGYAIKPWRTWLAKTDRLPFYEEKAWQKKLGISRPHHACEGAVASGMFLGTSLLGNIDVDALSDAERDSYVALISATISAIARHHTPLANSHKAVAWDTDARAAINDALTACGIPVDATAQHIDLTPREGGDIDPFYLVSPTSATLHSTWLSFVLVRALRLCDQRAERNL